MQPVASSVTVKVTSLLLHWPASVLTTMLAGQVITGGSLSLTVTVKLQLAVFPATSVAVQLTGVVPFGKLEPEDGEQEAVATEQLSAAVGAA